MHLVRRLHAAASSPFYLATAVAAAATASLASDSPTAPCAKVLTTSCEAQSGDNYARRPGTAFGSATIDETAETEGLDAVVEEAASGRYECVCVGEVHDDPVAHAVEHFFLRSLAVSCRDDGDDRRPFALSLEMFERDTQSVMDEYLSGLAREGDLLKDGRAWPNYSRDYRPLVEFCKAEGLPVVCANAPRRHVSLVGRRGMRALSSLPPSPVSLPLPVAAPSDRYASKFEFTMRTMGTAPEPVEGAEGGAPARTGDTRTPRAEKDDAEGNTPGAAPRECPYIGLNQANSHMLDAQCLWDAAMAHSVVETLARLRAPTSTPLTPQSLPNEPRSVENDKLSPLVLHVCGKFHCEHHLGIPERLHECNGVRTLVVACVPSAKVHMAADKLPEAAKGMADFLVLTDATVPRSFDVTHPI